MAMANRHCHLCDLPEIKPETWVPNNSFLLNTLTTTFKAIQSTFRSLEMHSKQRYKICICSDIVLGGTLEISTASVLFFPKISVAI